MGVFLSTEMAARSYRIFQFVNDVHIAIGSGLLGVLVFIYNGMKKESFRILCFSVITALCISYYFNNTEMYSVSTEKVIFITGCDSGLGFSLAQHCTEMGFTVIAGCLNLQSEGAIILDKTFNNKMILLEIDITNENSVKKALERVELFLTINAPCEFWALVNNAGIMVFGEFEWQTENLIKQQLYVNIYGTMLLTKTFLPILRKSGGRIVTVSSHCANATLPGLSVYGASKSALSSWSDGLRLEMAKYDVPVITFIPGSFVQQSNIMAKQNQNVYEMQTGMTQEQLLFYGDYFKEYNTYLSALSGPKQPKKIDNDKLYNVFEQILLEKNPRAVYIHESLTYKIYHTIFRFSPWIVRDFFINQFVQMPRYKPQRSFNQVSNAIA